MDKYNTSPIPEYGDLMTIEQFKKTVACGGFIDYDGCGELATEDKSYNITVYPSTINKIDIPDFITHVIWYNN